MRGGPCELRRSLDGRVVPAMALGLHWRRETQGPERKGSRAMLFLLSFFRRRGALRLASGLLALAAAAAPVAAQSDESFYSVVENGVTVERAGDAQPAEEDQMVFAGDRLTTTFSARAEVVLADAVIHVGGSSELVFAALAGSGNGDAAEGTNLLLLERGELLVTSDGATPIRIDTDNATVYLGGAGAYRIERDADSTMVIVRQGDAELRTRQGTVVVAVDEHAWVLGDGSPVVEPAAGADALERWAAALDARRDRLASASRLRSWWGGFWSVFWDEDGFDPVFHSVDVGDCDDGITVCRHGGGGAARTRPPRQVPDLDDPPAEEPDVAAVTKPWPLDGAGATEPVPFPIGKPPLDTNVSESPESTADVAVGGVYGPEASPPKPSADEAPPSSDATVTVGDEPSTTTTSEASTTSEPTVSTSSSSDTSTTDSSTSDSSSASVESSSTSYDASTSDTSSVDSGSSPEPPSAPEAPPPPEHGIEPN